MIFRDIKKVSIDVNRVNSIEKKQKNDNKYFNSFISDILKNLSKKNYVICFSKEQVNEISKIVEVEVKYDEANEWWFIRKKGK